MKKTILTAFAALLVAIPAVEAQKVNKEALLAKIEKSDADIANEKKSVKAATWINRPADFLLPDLRGSLPRLAVCSVVPPYSRFLELYAITGVEQQSMDQPLEMYF